MYSQINGAMICWSQRTKAEMTMASMHVPTLHEARAEGISRAFPISTFHSASVFAGAAREGCR